MFGKCEPKNCNSGMDHMQNQTGMVGYIARGSKPISLKDIIIWKVEKNCIQIRSSWRSAINCERR